MESQSDVDFAALIDRASQEVQRSRSVHVTGAAKAALLARVEQHRDAALEELRAGRITTDGIREAAVAQLSDAITIVGSTPRLQFFIEGDGEAGTRSIGSDAVELSMQWKCHWVPWC